MEIKSQVSLHIDQNIGILVIENPPENYLVTPEFIKVDILRDWIEKNLIKGLIISGAGRHFSGGAGLENLLRTGSDSENLLLEIGKGKALLRFIENLDIPVIAAIRGVCFGGGLEIALACHIRISSENALFAFPEANHGMIPGLGGITRALDQTSFRHTIQMVLSGDMINAEEAKTMNLIDHIVPNEELMSYSTNLLRKMTEGRSLRLINYVMKALHNARTMNPEKAMEEETRMFCELVREKAMNS